MDCWLFTLAPRESFPQTGTLESAYLFCPGVLSVVFGYKNNVRYAPVYVLQESSALSLMDTQCLTLQLVG